jgi:hypothetical protein
MVSGKYHFTAEVAENAEKSLCSLLHHLECPPFLRLNKLTKEVPHSRDLSAAGGTRACLPGFKIVEYGLPDSVFVELERDT